MKTTRTIFFLFTIGALFPVFTFAQKKPMIKTNHTFTEGLLDWQDGNWGDERSTPEAAIFIDETDGHDDKFSVKVRVDKATKDNPSKIFLRRNGIKLKKGKTYTITFWVKSKVADDSVKLLIYSSDETGSSKKWGGVVDTDLRFFGDGSWQNLSYTFEAKDKFPGAPADYGKLAISVGFGSRKGLYNIDNFKLIRVD